MVEFRVSIDLDTMVSFVEYIEKNGGGYDICDKELLTALRQLQLGMSSELPSSIQEKIICPIIKTIPTLLESMFVHYSGSCIEPTKESSYAIGEYLLTHLGKSEIANINCMFQFCSVCSRITTDDICRKILNKIDIPRLLLFSPKSEQLVAKIIHFSTDSIQSIIASPLSLYSPTILRSQLNTGNQLVIHHIRKGNLQAVRYAIELRVGSEYVVEISSESDPLILEAKRSDHSKALMTCLSRRADFRASISIE